MLQCKPAARRRRGATSWFKAPAGLVDSGAVWLDALMLALIAWLAWAGARAGPGVAGLRLLGLPLAYGAALAAGYAFGPALTRELGWSSLAATLAAGSAGLLGVQVSMHLLTRAARERADEPTAASQALGAVLGGLRGALYVLPILWLGGLAEGARTSGLRPELPDLSSARLPQLATRAIGAGAGAVVDARAPGGRMAVQLAAHPGEAVAALQGVVADPRCVVLQGDTGFWREVERGAVTTALARPAARALVNDRAFRARLATIGAVSPGAARQGRVFEVELAAALAEVGPRLAAIRSDPAFAALRDDPALRASLASGNSLALLRDPRFRALVSRTAR